jgi:hypothetical protein
MAREMMWGALIVTAVTTGILTLLIALALNAGGAWRVPGGLMAVVLVLCFWRGLRQVFRLWRGDLSL